MNKRALDRWIEREDPRLEDGDEDTPSSFESRMIHHPKREAVIEETPSKENSYSYKVRVFGLPSTDEEDQVMFLRGLGAPSPGHVGQKGTVQYQATTSYGLYFWSPKKEHDPHGL